MLSAMCRTVLMGLYFLSLWKCHCPWAEVIKEFDELSVIEVTGLWVCSWVSVLKKTCPNTSIYLPSSPGCKQGVLTPGCQERVLGEVADGVCLYLVPEHQGWVNAFKYISAQIFPPILGDGWKPSDSHLDYVQNLRVPSQVFLHGLNFFLNLNNQNSGMKIVLVNTCWRQLLICIWHG